MNPKFRNNVIGLAVALMSVLTGYGLGEPPRDTGAATTVEAGELILPMAAAPAANATRNALVRHLAMPYVSLALPTPRQES
ncbi:hypothetical protein [Arenimonas composti]|uniref:Uncharacterized protein n=1 Tax=Arenimonas composti TR7-09 = DSM 18010 TaxID=1121013 RepID=A0A091BGK5_9GAMM|nr:hypothetical protein [Arenimonas composti]KFN50881.1 hypothetical protein P873_00605 [Arenimonas composti TR7-09 = DSM 18010]